MPWVYNPFTGKFDKYQRLQDETSPTLTANLAAGNYDLANVRRVYVTTYLQRVRNESGGTLAQGVPVYVVGEGTNMVTVAACDITDRDKMPCIGLVFAAITNNADGYVVTDGVLRGNTSGFTGDVNERVYVQSGGTIDTGEPTSGSVQRVGLLAKKASGTAGVIYVSIRGRECIFSAADEHPALRMGSDVGHTKVSFHKYDNTEIGYYDEDGVFKVVSLTDGTNSATVADIKDAVDKKHVEAHTITSHSDIVDATGAQIEELTGAGATTLHKHDHGNLDGLTDDDHTQYTKKATLTAKGSIYAASATSTPAELAVGSAGQGLVVDSGETTGLKWADLDGMDFVNRGDPSAFDWTHATLTTDGDWHDLDCSSIVPAGAEAILLRVYILDDANESFLQFRPNGNTNAINAPAVRSGAANIAVEQTITVSCDSNRVIEYRGSNTTFTEIYVAIPAWYVPASTQPQPGEYVNRGNVSEWDWEVGDFTTDGNWHDLDCSSIVPAGAIAISFCYEIQDELTGAVVLFRENGIAQYYNSDGVATQAANVAVIGRLVSFCDSNRVIEYYTENTTWTTINVAITGWWM